MPVRARAPAAGVRNFDVRAELMATADRRKRPSADAGRTQQDVTAPQGGVDEIAARLAEKFPNLPADTVRALVSELFRSDPHCSRQQLADRSLAALVQMGTDAGHAQAVASFEPPSCTDPADPGAYDEALDALLAELLLLPDAALALCVGTLRKMLSRIAEKPEEDKFRQVKKANPRFAAEVGCHGAALALLLHAGFVEEGIGEAATLSFRGDPVSSEAFVRVHEALRAAEEALGEDACGSNDGKGQAAPPAAAVAAQERLASSARSSTSRDSRRQHVAALAELRLKDPRGFRADAVRRRGPSNPTSGAGVLRPASAPSEISSRRSQHFTLADIERMRIQEEIAGTPNYAEEYRQKHHAAPAGNYSTLVARSYDPELIARQALDGTNRYRASKGLAPLRWHDGIARIAREHAEQMASGRAPFSHDGFDKRVAAFPVIHRSAAENLALNSGVAEVATAAVDGWIKSPGHEKNLRGAFNLCSIGVAQAANGTFYLTQLFAQAL